MKKWILLLGILVLLFRFTFVGQVILYIVDLARKYKKTHLVFQNDDTKVSFVQKAYGDFYR